MELTPKEIDIIEIVSTALIKGAINAPEDSEEITVTFEDEDLLKLRERLSRE